jgi:Protein of unknown function (DUF3102)
MRRKKTERASGPRRSSATAVSTTAIARSAGARKPTLAEHAEAIRALRKQTIENIIEIGRRLVDVRDNLLEHGEWLPWLEREFAWSRQTADHFIHVYEARDKLPTVGNLELPITALYLLAAPSTPDSARQEISARIEAGESVAIAEVKQTIAEHRQPARKPPLAEQRAEVGRKAQRAHLGDEIADQQEMRRLCNEAVHQLCDEASEYLEHWNGRLRPWLKDAILTPEAKAELVQWLHRVCSQFTLWVQRVDGGSERAVARNGRTNGPTADTASR